MHPDIQVRNPGFTKADYEAVFRNTLESTMIWLGNGVEGDDTHGHIDDLCRFINEDIVDCNNYRNRPKHTTMSHCKTT
jgi:agmatine deiminase